jgi:hypothetical protein
LLPSILVAALKCYCVSNYPNLNSQRILSFVSYIKEYIQSFPGKMYIQSTNSDDKQYIEEIPNRYDLALQHPENWHIEFFDGFGTTKQEDKEFRNRLSEFQKLENHYACRLYLAQKITAGLKHKLLVLTDSEYPEPDTSGEVLFDEALGLALVRPVIHCIGMRID